MPRQPEHELLEVVAARHHAVDEREQARAVLRLDAVRGGEKEVRPDDAQGVAQRRAFERVAAERDRLVEQRQAVAERAVGAAREQDQALVVGRDALAAAHLGKARRDLGHGDAAEVEALRPAQDRRQDLVRLGRGEDEEDVRRRLLERLEERVPGRLGQHVRLVQDVDLLFRALGREAHGLAQVPDVVDAVVARRVDLDDVQRAALLERDARLAGPAGLGAVALRERPQAVDGLGEQARGGRLAHAARAGEHVGLPDAVHRHGVAERLGDVVLGHQVAERLRAVLASGGEVARALGGVRAGGVGGHACGAGGAARRPGRVTRNIPRGPPRPGGCGQLATRPPGCRPSCRRGGGRRRRRAPGPPRPRPAGPPACPRRRARRRRARARAPTGPSPRR